MRRGPKATVIGAHVWDDPTPADVQVRRHSINAMIMDLSIPPGVRNYTPGTPMPKESRSDIPPAVH